MYRGRVAVSAVVAIRYILTGFYGGIYVHVMSNQDVTPARNKKQKECVLCSLFVLCLFVVFLLSFLCDFCVIFLSFYPCWSDGEC
jgi:hypothetical protein